VNGTRLLPAPSPRSVRPGSIHSGKRARKSLIPLVGCALCGCFAEPIAREVPPDAPTELRARAAELAGAALTEVLTPAEQTLVEVPLDTRTIRRVAQRVKPSVVSLYVQTRVPVRRRLLPLRIPGGGIRTTLPGEGLGSGFFVHRSGLVITNAHVVEHASAIRGLTAEGRDFELEVLAIDPVYDLALLQAVGLEGDVPALEMGASDEIGVGDLVIAVGNPLGLGHTVTLGIVSQTDRGLAGVELEGGREVHFIQTDAAINPGSSGGPLIALTGAWVGVNAAGIPEAQNLGFSVPSGQVLEFVQDVIAGRGRHVE